MKKLDACYESDIRENIFDGQAILPLDKEFLARRFNELSADRNMMIMVMEQISKPKTYFITDVNYKGRIESTWNTNVHKYLHDMGIHSMKGIDGTDVSINDIFSFTDAMTFNTSLG